MTDYILWWKNRWENEIMRDLPRHTLTGWHSYVSSFNLNFFSSQAKIFQYGFDCCV